jgi:hypothetical protein
VGRGRVKARARQGGFGCAKAPRQPKRTAGRPRAAYLVEGGACASEPRCTRMSAVRHAAADLLSDATGRFGSEAAIER